MISIYVIFGFLSGYFAGFLGLGAGAFLMPFFMIIGLPYDMAVYSSLMSVFFSSIAGALLNLKARKPLLEPCIVISITAAIFAMIGSFYLIHALSPILLMLIFAGLEFLNADFYKNSSAKTPDDEVEDASQINHYHNFPLYIAIGIMVGLAASLLGIGGGIIIIPLLLRFAKFPVKDAVTTAIVIMIFSSFFGMSEKILNNTLPYMIGLPTALGATIGSFLGSLALKYVKQTLIIRCNYVISIILGLIMVYKAITY